MFNKDSRYSKRSTYAATDVNGNSAMVVYPGTQNSVESFFEHTISENDRLDILANKYYKKPKKWWQICDANQGVMFPSDLLSSSPIGTVMLELEITETAGEMSGSLALLMKSIKEIKGVIDAIPGDTQLVNYVATGKYAETKKENITICIEFNKNLLSIGELNSSLDNLRNDYLEILNVKEIERVGEKISLPPDQIIR